jgi:3-isopropylmalate dehydrogenase
MLEHLGLDEAARAVEEAVVADLAARIPGGAPRRTSDVGDAIAARVATTR